MPARRRVEAGGATGARSQSHEPRGEAEGREQRPGRRGAGYCSSNSSRWRKGDHWRPFRQAAAAAGLDPAEITLYALRHSSIVRELLAGVPVRVTAAKHDTSVAIVEATYSKYISDHADALSRRALLDPNAGRVSNVTALRGRQ